MSIRKWAVIGVMAICMPLAVVVVGASLTKLPGEKNTLSGLIRSDTLYLKTRDDVRIAIDVWLPSSLAKGERVPTLIRSTRYWRHQEYGFLERILYFLGRSSNDGIGGSGTRTFNKEGFAVVLVDMRGSGASFGSRSILWHPDEVEDLGEVTDWIVEQSWSNGKVGAFGISYEGNTSMMLAASGRSAVGAVSPLFDVYDLHNTILAPGGVLNRNFVEAWSGVTHLMDQNDLCGVAAIQFGRSLKPYECFVAKLRTSGVKPAGKKGRQELKKALQQRNNADVYQSVENVEYRGDPYGRGEYTLEDVTGFNYAKAAENSDAAIFAWASWMDSALVDGAIARFQKLSNPQILTIGPYSHGGFQDVDPFVSVDTPVEPDVFAQYRSRAEFLSDYLGSSQLVQKNKEIRYFTMGDRKWKTTQTWPPNGVEMQRMYFSAEETLIETPPQDVAVADTYEIDFTASSGDTNTRWHTSFGGVDVIYGDRAQADKKLLRYTSVPMDIDTEITGNAVLHLFLSSTHEDGAVHAYLEDVAPDGSVTYITEGVLRLIHHKISVPEECPNIPSVPCHTLREKDVTSIVPGEIYEVEVGFYATSAMIKKEHKIRVSIAGADSHVFERYPAIGNPTWKVQRNTTFSSFIDVPIQKMR